MKIVRKNVAIALMISFLLHLTIIGVERVSAAGNPIRECDLLNYPIDKEGNAISIDIQQYTEYCSAQRYENYSTVDGKKFCTYATYIWILRDVYTGKDMIVLRTEATPLTITMKNKKGEEMFYTAYPEYIHIESYLPTKKPDNYAKLESVWPKQPKPEDGRDVIQIGVDRTGFNASVYISQSIMDIVNTSNKYSGNNVNIKYDFKAAMMGGTAFYKWSQGATEHYTYALVDPIEDYTMQIVWDTYLGYTTGIRVYRSENLVVALAQNPLYDMKYTKIYDAMQQRTIRTWFDYTEELEEDY